jgi:hypothetical protein
VWDWQISEVVSAVGGDRELRYVELYTPPGTVDNCLYNSSRLEVFDAAGGLLGTVTPFQTTTCYNGETYLLLATPEAQSHFGVQNDAALPVRIPAQAGQVCFKSSSSRYDCVRWGAITKAVVDLNDSHDESTAPPIPDGAGLSRLRTTGIVAVDFEVRGPTPRQPNNGSVWIAPDAGPDAAPPDAAPPDAPPIVRPDSRPYVPPDAKPGLPKFWNADPGGGAAIACDVGAVGRRGGGGVAAGLGLALFACMALLHRRRSVS